MTNKNTDFIASFAKGLSVIEAFSATSPRMSITETAAKTGLDRATARRCLLTLSALGYADHDGKFFTLTPQILRLGMAALTALPLPQIVQPWLDQLSEQIGQSTSVAIMDGTEIIYIARASQRRVMSIGLLPGSRLPAHCTSLGRVLLAEYPTADARALLNSTDLSPRTRHSITQTDHLLTELARVKANQYAIVDQEVEIGLRSIAVPLRDIHGTTVAALNIGCAAFHEKADDLAITYLADLRRVQSGLQKIIK